MKTNFKEILSVAALGMSVLTNIAPTWAGNTSTVGVYVETNQDWATASGSMVGARYSSDDTQFIACSITGRPDFPATLRCDASNSAGKRAFCLSLDPRHVRQLEGMTDTSYIYFLANRTNGLCERVRISNGSNFLK